MKRIIVIGEGPTEQRFCDSVLKPHFLNYRISIENPKIKKSGGGMVSWPALKRQIENYLFDPSVYVTLLIDYYGIEDKHLLPHWNESLKIADKNQRLAFLETGMLADINEAGRYRFIPYIQLHEFEGLLFCELDAFDELYEQKEFKDYNYLLETINSTDNPEIINDGKETSPSHRLKRIFVKYSKTTNGIDIAEMTGLEIIRTKCPRFNEWISKLEKV